MFDWHQSNCYFRSSDNTYLSFDVGLRDGKRVVMQLKNGMLRAEHKERTTNQTQDKYENLVSFPVPDRCDAYPSVRQCR